ncbi:MAG: class I SAM-dependent methyltransferase [Pseudomonadota bacterium]
MATKLFQGDHADTYDTRIPRLVPGYRLAQELAYSVLQTLVGETATILVVGAGTGAELLFLAGERPHWNFIAVEPSADMADILRHKVDIAGLKDRVEIVRQSIETFQGEDKSDAAMANLVSHFIQGDSLKLSFFSSIARNIREGGPLLHLEYVPEDAPVTPAYQNWARWAGQSSAEVQQMSQRIGSVWDAARYERLCSVLQEAGFATTKEFFRALDYQGLLSR